MIDFSDLKLMGHVIRALCGVGKRMITLLAIVHSDALEDELEEAEELLEDWVRKENLIPHVRCRAIATDARVEAIVREGCTDTPCNGPACQAYGLRRLFFGSLAEDLAGIHENRCSLSTDKRLQACFPTSATRRFTLRTLSGLSEMESIPSRTRNSAKSG